MECFKFGFVGGLAPTIMSLLLWRRWHGEAVTDEEKGQRTTIRGKEKLGVGPISLLLSVLLIHRYRGPPSPKGKAKTNCNLLFTSQMYLFLFYHKSHEKASADLKNGQETGERKQKYLPKIRPQNRAYFTKIRRHTNYLQSQAGNPLTT